jgi:tetratricopeptide (TPR) repeat protein
VQRLFQKLDEDLRGFIDQRDKLLLLVKCRDEECGYLLKTLEAIDESTPHIFWMFAESFGEPGPYVESVVKGLTTRLEALAKTIAEAGGEPWPPLPPRLLDVRLPPVTRMQLLALYLRKRIPDLEAQRLVIALSPLRILDPIRWRAFLRELSTYDPAAPWCHHVRLIAREALDVALPTDTTGAVQGYVDPASFPSADVCSVDFSLGAMQQAVKDNVEDKSLPLADRCQALLIDAMVDYAHQRYEPAMAKYQLLRSFYAALGLEAMLALVLNGIGEIFARIGSRDPAVQHFEMAITPAANSNSYPVLLNISLNLGNLYLGEENWTQASDYYVGAEALATACLNAHVKLSCLENIGVCRLRLSDYAGAQKAWQDGATLARALKEDESRKRMLTRLQGLYTEARMRDQLQAVEQELRGLP